MGGASLPHRYICAQMKLGRMAVGALLVALWALEVVSARPTEVRWCVPYDQPESYADLCTEIMKQANTKEIEFKCVPGGSVKECMRLMNNGDAHVSTFDGADMMLAYRLLDIKPLVFENYGRGQHTSYYAVAAVRKEFCTKDTTLESLRGVRSCHTGYRKTAGWFSPLGTLLAKGAIQAINREEHIEDDAETVAEFFSTVCAPRTSGIGPMRGENGRGILWSPLCEGCAGDCTVHDRYYDYHGAFRCLVEDAGDVAFLRDSTISEFALGGVNAAPWAHHGADAYRLICPEGGCKSVYKYESCHMARVPSHSIVAPGPFSVGGENEELGKKIQQALVQAAGKKGFLESASELNGQKNFIFKENTVGLDPVTTTVEEAVGEDFFASVAAVVELSG